MNRPLKTGDICMIIFAPLNLKGTATLVITIFYIKDLNKRCILIPVTSKSVEERRSVNICKWAVMEAAIL